MDTDADRLAMIKSLGGQLVSVRGREFWAIFDNDFALANGMVESSGPALTCRTSDFLEIGITKNDAVLNLPESLVVKDHQPDGTGMSIVMLRT